MNQTSFNLYYLFKGIAKAIPVVGAVLEESIFNQYEEELKQQFSSSVEALSPDEQLSIEKLSVELSSHMQSFEFIVEKSLAHYTNQINQDLLMLESKMLSNFDEVGDELDTMKGMLAALHRNSEDTNGLKKVLADIERRRLSAIRGLSVTQQQVLRSVPAEPMLVPALLDKFRHEIASLADVRDKELHLRLHELRYLGLVERKKANLEDEWLYWRSSDSDVVVFL